MEQYLVVFTLLLTTSFLFSDIFRRLKYPTVIGQILAGIVLGSSVGVSILFSGFDFQHALENGNPVAIMIDILSNLGIVFLLLLVGMEIDYEKLKRVGRDAGFIAFSAAVIPFAAGSLLMKVLGYPTSIALIVGACLSVTAEGTKVMVLMELDKLNTRLGEIMIGAGVMDDVFEFLFLSILVLVVSGGQGPSILESVLVGNIPLIQSISGSLGSLFYLFMFPTELILFVFFAYMLFSIFPNIIGPIKRGNSEINEFMAIIIFGLLISIISAVMGLGTIIGALIAGFIIQASIRDRIEKQGIVTNLKMVSLGLIVPFFFMSMGLHFNSKSLIDYPMLFILITFVAVAAKIFGTMMIKPLTDLSWRQVYLIGWGMNSRGVVELIIASIAIPIFIQENALEVFSVIVSMAIVTTLMFPVVLKREIQRDPRIME